MIKNYEIIIKKDDIEVILHSAKEFFERNDLQMNDIVQSVIIQYENENRLIKKEILSNKPLGCLVLKDLMIKI